MFWPHRLTKRHIDLEDIVKVGDYVYRLDETISDEYKVTRLQVTNIKTDEKETSEECFLTMFIFNDRTLTLSDGTKYKMSHLIYKSNIYVDINFHLYRYDKNLPYTKIFLTKELAYNYLYWMSYNKSTEYKNRLLDAQRKFNIWDNKEKLYKKYKDLKTEKRFEDYEYRKFDRKTRAIYDSEQGSDT